MSNRISVRAEGHSLDDSLPLYADGYRSVLEEWGDAGITVLALHDTPYPGKNIPDCISAAEDDYERCDGKAEDWILPEPVRDVVARLGDPDVRFADLNDHICDGSTCRAVNGGVITYFDNSHVSATYAASLAPYLGRVLLPLLPGPGRSPAP
jgi:hypothetical protein